MKTTTKTTGEACSICQIEFPHAQPNVASLDALVPGLGWCYLCEHHAVQPYARLARLSSKLVSIELDEPAPVSIAGMDFDIFSS